MKGLRQSNKGFTLVELVVVMVIFSIVASISTLGLISWQQNTINNKANENAELIYMAIKNKLAILRANDAVDEIPGWLESASYNGDLNDDDILESETLLVNKSGNYCMMCDKTDYDKYTKKQYNEMSDGSKTLFDFICPFIQDKKILNASICVEYTEAGDIIAVYYCDRCNAFDFRKNGKNSESKIYLVVMKQKESAREKFAVGMYAPK